MPNSLVSYPKVKQRVLIVTRHGLIYAAVVALFPQPIITNTLL